MTEQDRYRDSLVPSAKRDIDIWSNTLVKRGLDLVRPRTPVTFAEAIVDSLRFVLAGMIRLREIQRTISRLQTSLAEDSSAHTWEEIWQVLSACRKELDAAYENIWDAIEPLTPFEPPARCEVFDTTGKIIRLSIQEDTAKSLILEYLILHASQYDEEALPEVLDRFSPAAPEEVRRLLTRLREAGDGNVERIEWTFRRIAGILAKPELSEHLKLTDAELEQLEHYIFERYGSDPGVVHDSVKPFSSGWPIAPGRAAVLLESTLMFVFNALVEKDHEAK